MTENSWRIFVACLAVAGLAVPVGAQVLEAWAARHDGGDKDEEFGSGVAVDDAGNVYVTGSSRSKDTGDDYLTVKYDRTGRLLWERRYDAPGHGDDLGGILALDAAGNVYVHGHAWAGDDRGNDYATIKYDPSGNEEWVALYDGPGGGDDLVWSLYNLAVDAAGNAHVTGYSMGTNGFYDFATLKYDTDGSLLWERRYESDGPANAYAYDVAVDSDGNVYVAGNANNMDGSRDYTLLKYDRDGALLWERQYDGPDKGTESMYAMTLDEAGNAYITGISKPESGPYDYATVKYAPNGDFQWAARYDNGGHDYGLAVAVDADQNVYVTGSSLSGGGQYDIVTLKYAPDGSQTWLRRWTQDPYFGHDWAWVIALDRSGAVYVSGNSWSGLWRSSDYVTLKYDLDGTLAWEQLYNGTGSGEDWARGIFVDETDNVYVTGPSLGVKTGPDYVTIKYAQAPCNIAETIKSAKCKTKRGQVKKVTVVVTNGWPGKEYTATLDTGEEIVKTAKPSGKMKFTFKGENAPPCGANGVTVCNEHKDFDCGC